MRHFLLFTILILLIGCKFKQSDKIVSFDNDVVEFDISLVDSLIKHELQPIDTLFFNKYIANNPVILGEKYDSPSLYTDGFWIKKYADSIKHDLVFNTFKKSQYFILPTPLKSKGINCKLILVVFPSENIMMVEHFALFLILLDKYNPYNSTILLAEKIKSWGLSSFDLITTSILKDTSSIEQTKIGKSCISDLPGPNGEITCSYDTTVTYYKILDRHIFDPFKRVVNWEIKSE
jgi:hypothetical protein